MKCHPSFQSALILRKLPLLSKINIDYGARSVKLRYEI